MTCDQCTKAASRQYHGGYQMQCLQCCGRLLATTTPQSPQAGAMLEAIRMSIARFASTFGLDDVKACARQIRAKRLSVPQRSSSLFGEG